ncbi:[FeFe] hydrogenase H-cluster radical SAM maturase HydE [Thiospirochaeta perfilievii]|uniref:[FeFe] hydrogenase H-cluster radical SAM maturase HydE n=1 Tax=Thiospirochaeta perfilievii TaxID=252967 RepID=A0A5C1QFT5_9SPIO|nr:[FeFe] hydrogenase H-cluster radical SAM maturase HydE [Thiospirochaeta perfilievii]QEN05072.1 [FeFe] hydrogenase H-cluster radical SAM maturase HydE [Thiospirochaeta perfilievii]
MIDRTVEEIIALYKNEDPTELYKAAWDVTTEFHGDSVYLRGLVEFTNKCVINCEYCGIRRDNTNVSRYSLDSKTIVDTCLEGFNKGLRTFVLQGGEDKDISVSSLCDTVKKIKESTDHKAAITLSFGSRSLEEYKMMKSAGADRYLLRFETSDPELHFKLRGISLEKRLKNIEDIRSAGLQVGSGYMTGLPGETEETRINNALLCKELDLDMVGIGPFIPSDETPLAGSAQEPIDYALRGTALLRLLLPKAHIPATTAAGSLKPTGREDMIRAGANVLMPNLTPVSVKKDYLLYPGKICLDETGSQCIGCMGMRVKSVGRKIDFSRADALRLMGISYA